MVDGRGEERVAATVSVIWKVVEAENSNRRDGEWWTSLVGGDERSRKNEGVE
uniref:Uncharacterized protein n=1 Tax=Nelumbo nucifera TaxID=4432 RepID=A0A822ZSB8_NELNU|nr:TPA_asm: hypothetical protein HUJ06_018741 [Nelumbo nucifera]